MATPGYEPFRKLAEIFWASKDLTEGQFDDAVSAVYEATRVNDPLGDEEDQDSELDRPAYDRFLESSDRIRLVSPEDTDVVRGLLQCIQENRDPDQHHPPRVGVYDHFKGGIYLITGYSIWASGKGEKVIEYTSLLFGTRATRLQSEWNEVVKWPDGVYRTRFVYRGPDLRVQAPTFKVPNPTHAPE